MEAKNAVLDQLNRGYAPEAIRKNTGGWSFILDAQAARAAHVRAMFEAGVLLRLYAGDKVTA